MDINKYFATKQSERSLGSRNLAKRITCADGFSISVQANEYAYCTPRDNFGPYSHVECGYPSEKPSDELCEYAEDNMDFVETIYPYVPVEIVERLLESHGGIKL